MKKKIEALSKKLMATGKSIDKENGLRYLMIIFFLIPIFLLVGYFANKAYDAHSYDFASYWQAAYMIQQDGDIYNPDEWLAVRAEKKTAQHSEIIFQYPLPFAVLISPLGRLSVGGAYTLWLFISQIFILVSCLILLNLTWEVPPIHELAIIALLFIFRPMYTTILSGQILSVMLFSLTLAILAYKNDHFFLAGGALSLLSLKPSIGIPISFIVALWFFAQKSKKAIAGMLTGYLALFLIGASYNPYWVQDYLKTGEYLLTKYVGMHATLWGFFTLIFQKSFTACFLTVTSALLIVSVQTHIFFYRKIDSAFLAISTSLPAALLIAPYSWSYDQVLLIIPIVLITKKLQTKYNWKISYVFLISLILIAAFLVMIAYQIGHDVFSLVISVIVWSLSVYFSYETVGNRTPKALA